MPTYEYACRECGQHLEVVQSFKDAALTECPACAGPLRKVFGNIGIAFKGSGFYKNDSRSSSSSASKASETKTATDTKTETSAKSDSPSTGSSSSSSSSSGSTKSESKVAAAS